ncbi:TIGR01777 family oxidoreductase [Arcanobacterium pinnipediorum]|uniref:TIGR01777 family oxidoreductase n=1 Tax=Arcanobacterium pinnipediorum TaxID=1503041 RepID=A0ABY5AJN4_9ACTO|nr:TIGR01777 family oxidoreductase [Arcanobacterium pinnipediorum]USR80067.1 TIGR01777 family oxidoreductase [Arcanobacterium pinnipediorum]
MSVQRPTLVIAGATGFIGSMIVKAAIHVGYDVIRLVRSYPQERPQHCTDVLWEPRQGKLDESVLAQSAAVVCLNGAPLIGKIWTEHYKEVLRDSRIDSVRTIVTAIGRLSHGQRPRCFISGSAIGYYGPFSDDEILTEADGPGSGFLAQLCQEWEREAYRCEEDFGVRTIALRTSLVMDDDGGLLGALSNLYRLGLGAQLSDGNMWMSTISLIDYARAVLFLVSKANIHGPVNMACPDPVRNRQWHKLLAQHLHRPSFLRAPLRPLAKLFPYAIGETVMASQRVYPQVLLDAGFSFTAETVPEIFAQVLPQAHN